MRIDRTPLAIFIGLGLSGLAQAQDVQQLDKITVEGTRPSYRGESSRTGTKTDTPFLAVPQSVQIVPRVVIEDQAATTLTDAVRNVAGTASDFGFNGGSLPLLLVRGFPAVSMTAYGPVSSSVYFNGTKVQGLPIAMSEAESIEVLKGPASVLYGRAEPGGLINVVSRLPRAERSFGLTQTFGSYGLSRSALEATGALDASGRWQGRIAASYDDNASDRDFVVDRLANVSAALAFVPSDRTRATLSVDRSRQRFRNDYGVPSIGDRPAHLDRQAQFNEGVPLSHADNTVVRLDIEQAFNAHWSLRAHALDLRQSGDQYDLIPTTYFTGPDELYATGQISRYYNYDLDRERRLQQFNADLVGKFGSPGFPHTLLLGVDHYEDRFESQSTGYVPAPSINIYDPVYGQVPPLDLTAIALFPQEGRTRWTGVYVQDQVDLGQRFSLLVGLRHDRTTARYGDPALAANRQSFTTPRVGAVWHLSAQQSVYAQYQEGVAANNGRNLSGGEVDAEQAKLMEVGHKWEAANGRLASTVALYELTKRNIANYVPDANGNFDVVALGRARSEGLEWDVSGQLNEAWSVIGSYAYTRTRVLDDVNYEGKRLANAPKQSGSVWLRYTPNERWSFGSGVFAQGHRAGDLGNTFELPGYGRWDLMGSYRFALGRAAARVQLNVNNALDRRYYTGSHQLVADWIQPGASRTVLATFHLDY